MTDIDDTIRTQLALLADEMPERDLAEEVVRRGRRARRRRALTAVAGTVVAVAGLLAAVLLVPSGSSSERPAPPVNSATPSAAVPTLPPDFESEEYEVPAPLLVPYIGPVPPEHMHNCAPSAITAIAHTIRSTDGVLGVARLRGRNCRLPGYQVTGLLDASGQPLSVTLAPTETPENPRPDIALYTANAAWGFAWRGSWCGPAAAAVQLAVVDRYKSTTLLAPLSGPRPACPKDVGDAGYSSTLVPGVIGSPTQPVEPAPAEWSGGLTAALELPGVTASTELTHMVVTLRNTTNSAIVLSPCPQYSLAVTSSVDEHAVQGPLDCGGAATVIPAYGEHRFSLADEPFGGYGTAQPGSKVTAEFAMANVPVTTGETRVRS